MVKLYPSDVQVDVGSWATFNCSVSCELRHTHFIIWFVGENRNRFVHPNFKQRTGIETEINDTSICGSTEVYRKQQLRVKILSAQKMNKTAVQCAALRRGPTYPNLYSPYSIIIVDGKQTY